MARDELPGRCRLAVGDMRASRHRRRKREMRRCLRPGGAAVITVPRFAHAASFTAESPMRWCEAAETSRGLFEGFGERHFDPARGCSVGRYELHNRTTGERRVRTSVESRVYPFTGGSPKLPGLVTPSG